MRILRPLALLNVLVAVGLGLPFIFWQLADSLSHSSMQVTSSSIRTPGAEQTAAAHIDSTTELRELRKQAKMLAEMETLWRQSLEVQGQVLNQFMTWLHALLGIMCLVFLANASAIFWASKKAFDDRQTAGS